MSKQTNDFPAFPLPLGDEQISGHAAGMNLRDYFAAKALQGICAHADTWGLPTSPKIANAAYELADAMLAERDK